jgi:hypothetical protein
VSLSSPLFCSGALFLYIFICIYVLLDVLICAVLRDILAGWTLGWLLFCFDLSTDGILLPEGADFILDVGHNVWNTRLLDHLSLRDSDRCLLPLGTQH